MTPFFHWIRLAVFSLDRSTISTNQHFSNAFAAIWSSRLIAISHRTEKTGSAFITPNVPGIFY